MNRGNFQKSGLLIVIVAISILFFAMIKPFIMTLLMAAIMAGLLNPLRQKFLSLFKERKTTASLVTLLCFVLLVVIPLMGFFGVVVNQALQISRSATPWIEEQIAQPDKLYERLRGIPGFEKIEPYRDDILTRLAGMAGSIGNFAVRALSAATSGTVAFLFQFFIFLYAMFFFLRDGEALLQKIFYYLPLNSKDEARLIEKFTSVTRATIKGTLVIGILQGTLAGIGLAVAGIGGAVFWGAVMVVLSIIPGIGTALVWVPAAIYLAAVGQAKAALLLTLYCGLIVGSIDNLLRPRLVGQDVQMPDLMILISTLGGIFLFGVTGFIIGPIVAALFMTIWDIYGRAFRYALTDRPPQRRPR